MCSDRDSTDLSPDLLNDLGANTWNYEIIRELRTHICKCASDRKAAKPSVVWNCPFTAYLQEFKTSLNYVI